MLILFYKKELLKIIDNTVIRRITMPSYTSRLNVSLLVSCFVLWGLLNNMTDNLVPAFAKIFMIKAVDSSLVQLAFYGAYAILALPAVYIVTKYSFRHGILIGLGSYVIGAFGYIPAAILQNYYLFLVSIFILETTCNPFILSLGDYYAKFGLAPSQKK